MILLFVEEKTEYLLTFLENSLQAHRKESDVFILCFP